MMSVEWPQWVAEFSEEDWIDERDDAEVIRRFNLEDSPYRDTRLRWHRENRWLAARRHFMGEVFKRNPAARRDHLIDVLTDVGQPVGGDVPVVSSEAMTRGEVTDMVDGRLHVW